MEQRPLQPSLDPLATEWIFGRLAVRYGDRWRAKWDGMPLEAVKADWAMQLAHCRREALMYAMEHLPVEFPPTVGQFLEIARRAPQSDAQQQIEDKRPRYHDRERMVELMTRLADAIRCKRPMAWAYALQEREARGEDLDVHQRAAWRFALARYESPEATETMMMFKSIDPECLPPAMRPARRYADEEQHA